MHSSRRVRGMALVTALLLLLVMTMLGVAMFRSFGMLERIAGNTREKQRALHAATDAQTYAEWWLTSSAGINATNGTTCAGFVVAPANGQVCSNVLTNVNQIPWAAGVTYTPPGMQVGSFGALDNYVTAPAFYISYTNGSYNRQTGTRSSSYQIDAVGYGGNSNTAAVAESAYNVSVTYTAQNSLKKFLDLGGP